MPPWRRGMARHGCQGFQAGTISRHGRTRSSGFSGGCSARAGRRSGIRTPLRRASLAVGSGMRSTGGRCGTGRWRTASRSPSRGRVRPPMSGGGSARRSASSGSSTPRPTGSSAGGGHPISFSTCSTTAAACRSDAASISASASGRIWTCFTGLFRATGCRLRSMWTRRGSSGARTANSPSWANA